jgi:NAD-dependent SIR2 family protein deacetylase
VLPVRYELNLNLYKKKIDRLCGLVVRVHGYTTEMYCVSCEVRTEFMYVLCKKIDRLCGLVVRVHGYTTEMYCASCEVRTEFIYVCSVEENRPPLWSSDQSSWLQNGDALCFLWGTN